MTPGQREIEILERKAAARMGVPGYAKNVKAIIARIAELKIKVLIDGG